MNDNLKPSVNDYGFADARWSYGPFAEAGINRDEVKDVLYEWSDSPEGYGSEDVMIIFSTTDGRYGFLEAWCDTTGWDCRAEALPIIYASSLAKLLPEITAQARRTFGFEATPDCGV